MSPHESYQGVFVDRNSFPGYGGQPYTVHDYDVTQADFAQHDARQYYADDDQCAQEQCGPPLLGSLNTPLPGTLLPLLGNTQPPPLSPTLHTVPSSWGVRDHTVGVPSNGPALVPLQPSWLWSPTERSILPTHLRRKPASSGAGSTRKGRGETAEQYEAVTPQEITGTQAGVGAGGGRFETAAVAAGAPAVAVVEARAAGYGEPQEPRFRDYAIAQQQTLLRMTDTDVKAEMITSPKSRAPASALLKRSRLFPTRQVPVSQAPRRKGLMGGI